MIVNVGKLYLLSLQVPVLETCEIMLFTNNHTITAATVIGDLVEAGWSGYSRSAIGTLSSPFISSGRAVVVPDANPEFTNGSGSPQNFYGWALLDGAGTEIVAAANITLQTIPDGYDYVLAMRISDTQE